MITQTFVSQLPVSVEELRPGSLCDLTRRRSPSLSPLPLSPSFSFFPTLRRRYRGWRRRDCTLLGPPPGSLAAEEDEVCGEKESGVAPWCEGVERRMSGMDDRCCDVEPPIASSCEQLLASMAWRRNTGDLEDKTQEHKIYFLFVDIQNS